jgi:L-lactate dehydrogenase complex protein LldE
MTVGLFIPCYIDQFYPQVGIATMQLLEKFGVKTIYPTEQTCCGQPMANSGCEHDAVGVYQNFVKSFADFDYTVIPSGSCTYHIKKHYDIIEQTTAVEKVRKAVIDLPDFLLNVLKISELDGDFNHQVGIHLSCHGQRGLRNSTASEFTTDKEGQIRQLLKNITGLTLTQLNRNDECCGFGGTFCVAEEAVSARMGIDRVNDHLKNGTQILTGGDMSCLMHLEGIIRRNEHPIKVMHIAEILNSAVKA